MAAIAKSENQPIFEPADWTAGTSRWGINKNALNRFGWEFKTPLEVGLGSVYEWMKKQKSNG